jgi:1-pyrroline-5-carboxylate dehydrogenase
MSCIQKVCFLLFVCYAGTNDKAGGPHYVLRWTSPQAIKETFVPLREWKYPYMSD